MGRQPSKKRGVVHEAWTLPDLRKPVDMSKLESPGSYLSTEESAAHKLARAIHYSESDACSVSWDAQKRAQEYINKKGLAAALTLATELEGQRAKADERGASDDDPNEGEP